jgi:hypothetical protein
MQDGGRRWVGGEPEITECGTHFRCMLYPRSGREFGVGGHKLTVCSEILLKNRVNGGNGMPFCQLLAETAEIRKYALTQ